MENDLALSICETCKQEYTHYDSNGVSDYLGCKSCRFKSLQKMFKEKVTDEFLKTTKEQHNDFIRKNTRYNPR